MGSPAETDTSDVSALPRISIQAFCASRDVHDAVGTASQDRRASRSQMTVAMGGLPAAVEAYEDSPTPNVIIVESGDAAQTLLSQLDELAQVCDPDTSVIVVGHTNDVLLYRQLMTRGVSEYLVWPFGPMDMISSIARLFASRGLENMGRTLAFVGAKGGVGASTIAHNVAWAISNDLAKIATIVDMDLAFGTAGLDFNQDPPQGIAEAIYAGERLDTGFIDKLFWKCSDRLSLIAAPSTLERDYDIAFSSIEPVIDLVRTTVPYLVLDLPHQWTNWTHRMLATADDVVIVAAPDLANLRNTKNLIDKLGRARRNDRAPFLVLNQMGVQKRPEIPPREFASAAGIEISAEIAFEPQLFGEAANSGQMISEVQQNAKAAETVRQLARRIIGHTEPEPETTSLLKSLLERLPKRGS
ncbi:MAG: AAA family ATPase [Pseudomonadota bacterium]